ncbi:hypothetical protein [Paludisphaera rhizosphaerae]|uniref:hypothetical protein n=1 Tax=Paludisphaera rhizosphaerae TaxID=2711216 RepID=UPI0013EAECE4|nr:hypothetical protein [Paludisphaera rhizosphaerae]
MGWQDVVAIGAVLAAAGYLASLVWRGVGGEKSGSCGTACGKCSSGAQGEPEQIVTIGAAPALGRAEATKVR